MKVTLDFGLGVRLICPFPGKAHNLGTKSAMLFDLNSHFSDIRIH